MNKESFIANIESPLQQKAGEPIISSSKCVWKSFYNNFHPIRRLPSATMSIILISSLLFLSYVNTNQPAKNTVPDQSQTGNNYNGNVPNKTSFLIYFKANKLLNEIKESMMQKKNTLIKDHSIDEIPAKKNTISVYPDLKTSTTSTGNSSV
jgi:hypothetical protein